MYQEEIAASCRSLAIILISLGIFQACGDTTFRAENGTLELNDSLRADLGASVDNDPGGFLADGTCPPGALNSDECKLITAVLPSMIAARNAQHPNRLRKSDFLWVAAEGFSQLSYEFVGRNVDIVSADDSSEVFASNVTVGTCYGFPMRDVETRAVLPALENVEFENLEEYIAQFDVKVRSCEEPTMNTGVSESLDPVTTACSEFSVASLYGANLPPAPQNSPFCVLRRGVGMLNGDVSYSIMPAAAPGHNLNDLWPGLDSSAKTLLPNLKTVPIDGTRTISRPATIADAGQQNDDGSTTYRYTWTVDNSGTGWSENFSPNVFVAKARVRRGPVGSNDFMTIDRLESGRIMCGTKNAASTEYDIPMCQPGGSGVFRTTPAYQFSALNSGPVTDAERISWIAFVRVPGPSPGPYNDLSLELDLAADSPTGSMGSGLMAAPPAIDLGSLRNGQQSSPPEAFVVRNYGVASMKVQSVATVGGNASEFGAPLIYRVDPAGVPTGTPITAPFILRADSRFGIRLQPHFQTIGTKQTEVVVSFVGISNTPQSIRLSVQAQSVSPAINLQPANLVFNAVAGTGRLGSATARRAALLSNDGPVTFDRTGFTISGPDAAMFRVLSAEYGPTPSDISSPQTLGPGEAEIYRLGYYPSRTGDTSAFLTVHTSEGDVRIQLHGWCELGCEQPPELAIDPPRDLPPVSKVDIIYPSFKVKWWPFGTTKTTRIDVKKTDDDKSENDDE